MALSPKKFREIVVQMLYAIELGGDEEGLCSLLMEELEITKKIAVQAHAKAKEIWEKKEDLDQQIKGLSKSFELERIGKMEKGILRFAISSLREESRPIVIAEAIRLTQKFASIEASGFVNALLDAIPNDESSHASLPT